MVFKSWKKNLIWNQWVIHHPNCLWDLFYQITPNHWNCLKSWFYTLANYFSIFAFEDYLFPQIFISPKKKKKGYFSGVCVCSLVCEHVKKRFPKPPSPPALVYLFSLMIVFLILAWLHSSAGVDCTVISLQMTSIWTVSIWHAFIYVGSGKAIFRWVSHFLSSFVFLTDQTFSWSFKALTRNS